MACTYNNILFIQSVIILHFCLSVFAIFLILLAGDIETNPGPGSADSLSVSSDMSDQSTFDLSVFEQNFSLVHYNIQSLNSI